jgi:holin-like protein
MPKSSFPKKVLQYLVSCALIMGSLSVGIAIQEYLHLSIPGSIIGMLLLFLLMISGLAPVEWVKPVAQLFIRYMVLLFVPISVGLIQYGELLSQNAIPILASTVGGTVIVLVILAKMLEHVLSRQSEDKPEVESK